MPAALALLAISLWLRKRGMRSRFLKIPMAIMFAITLTALGVIFHKNLLQANYALAVIAAALFVLAITLVWESIRSLKSS